MVNHYATALNATPSYGERFGKKLFTLVLIAIPLGLVGAAAMAYVKPKIYESCAVVQVNPVRRINTVFHEGLLPSQMTPQFSATQIEIMRSQMTLQMVAEKLNLAHRWNTSDDEAIIKLVSIVDAKNIRGTDLIAITVRHTGPEDACDIAQAVYESYKERRLEAERKISDGAIRELEEAMLAHSAVVEDKRKLVQELESNLLSATTQDTAPNPSNETLLLKMHMTLLTQAKNDDERMLLAAMMLYGDSPVKLIYQKYLKAGEDLEKMQKNGLGDDQPTHVMQKNRIREISEQLQTSLSKYVQELQIQVGSDAANSTTAGSGNDDLILRAQIQSEGQELVTQETLLEEMKQKFANDEINLKQPQNIIALHEAPEIAKAPSSPRLFHFLIFGGIGLPLSILLLGLPLTGIIHLASRN